jgi:hypothetical protein
MSSAYPKLLNYPMGHMIRTGSQICTVKRRCLHRKPVRRKLSTLFHRGAVAGRRLSCRAKMMVDKWAEEVVVASCHDKGENPRYHATFCRNQGMLRRRNSGRHKDYRLAPLKGIPGTTWNDETGIDRGPILDRHRTVPSRYPWARSLQSF